MSSDHKHLDKMRTPSLDTLRALRLYLIEHWSRVDFIYDDLPPREQSVLSYEQFFELCDWIRRPE